MIDVLFMYSRDGWLTPAPPTLLLLQGKTVNVNGEEKKGKIRNFNETIDLQVCVCVCVEERVCCMCMYVWWVDAIDGEWVGGSPQKCGPL